MTWRNICAAAAGAALLAFAGTALADDDPGPAAYSQALSGKRVALVPMAMGFDRAQGWAAYLKREVEGFILNRLQAVLLSEAFRLVGDGYVTPQDLDKTLKHGLGLRWSFMGPFETIELNAPAGISDYCRRYGASLSALSAADPAIYEGDNLARIVSQSRRLQMH